MEIRRNIIRKVSLWRNLRTTLTTTIEKINVVLDNNILINSVRILILAFALLMAYVQQDEMADIKNSIQQNETMLMKDNAK